MCSASTAAKRRQQPELTHPELSRVEASSDEAGRWLLVRRGRLRIAANIGPHPQRLLLSAGAGHVLISPADGVLVAGDTISMPPASFAVVRT
jgi:maltooligosyltrehalose trehalohydrolase